ncbi:Mediator of RNA polymerase II transcription subunit 17-like protein [Elsinoe fawcettii]|nr:Mediator of RNA polymerase II transcription subunit 17-like protein [Elsinoe fawcettii]
MGDYTGTVPPSLRPWATNPSNTTSKSFSTVLARLHSERGHFRDITTASLQDELTAAAIAGPASPASSPRSRSPSPAAKDARPRADQLATARREVIAHVASAQNETLLALDFVSLLLSKDVRAAEATISPVLKQNVPTGSLGVDMWEGMPEDTERERIDGLLARGKRLEGLKGAAEGLSRAEERLRGTVERERKYWDGILGVREKGWSVCRIPRERGTLGVRYGFSESLGEYKSRGLAALRMDADGELVLDRGLGREGKGLRVRIKKADEVLGESVVKQTDDEEADVSKRIKTARDSLFEEELWHEIMREGREMGSYGVKMKGDTIIAPLCSPSDLNLDNAPHTLEIDLVSTDNLFNPAEPSSLANGIATSLRLLLSHTHRQRLEQRSRIPSPISANKQDRPIAHIIRPLLSHLHQRNATSSLLAQLQDLTTLLSHASITSSTTTSSPLPSSLSSISTTSILYSTLTGPPTSTTTLSISAPSTPAFECSISCTTAFTSPTYGTQFVLSLPSSPEQRFSKLDDLLRILLLNVAGHLTLSTAGYLQGWKADRRGCRVVRPAGLEGRKEGGEEVRVRLAREEEGAVLVLGYDGEEWRWSSRKDEEGKTWEGAMREVQSKVGA